MSRVIKFRGWDSVNEVMLPVESINFREGCVSLNEGDNSLTDTLEMIELMQYTGLKDKNGDEIYVGDILINTRKSKLNLGIENQKYLVVYKTLGIDLKPLFKGIALKFDYSDLKKIGNLYENSELLEVENE